MAKNHYGTLGLGSDATQDEIKSAYRRKAKEFHPDRYEGGCEPFCDVQEAYEILSDPARRQTYDDELSRRRRYQVTPIGRGAESLQPSVEPLIPAEPPIGVRRTIFERSSGPSFEEVFDRLWDNLGLTYPRGQRTEEIQVSVVLTPAQALHGGRTRIWIPVQTKCPACRGRGGVDFYTCWQCSGRGYVAEELPVTISVPAGVSDDSLARVPLDRLGLQRVSLLIRFRIQGW